MQNPIKQHYIPRSYLKNFALEGKKGKQFVDVYKLDDKILLKNINTKDICFKKNIYTIPAELDETKYALEKHYAEHVDSEFPKIYKLLIDEKILVVTLEQKRQILYVFLSLYFRTPKILNLQNEFNNEIFDTAAHTVDDEGIIKMNLYGEKIKFHIADIEQIKKKYSENVRISFLVNHLEQWSQFVEYKYDCTINIIKINDSNAPLITCDNPVTIRHMVTNKFCDIYDVNSVITIPLDPIHFIEIHPNKYADGQTRISRITQDRDYVFTTNTMTQENAEKLLIGYKGTIEKHFQIQKTYEDLANKDEFVAKAQFKAEQSLELLQILKQNGFESQRFINKLKKLLMHPYLKDDSQMLRFKKLLSIKGKW